MMASELHTQLASLVRQLAVRTCVGKPLNGLNDREPYADYKQTSTTVSTTQCGWSPP